ncbi:molecular chaperone HtpG [Roseivirga ehrenbergii]|uniref:Chaperone protein HtpG n=1 Tax=Roseivirga ehrenbergii (strain DSM 102268 / JCM 13514 / KCTC 12282 / NCIMB 14502 / KMM 6017) TaxID=279360 RepID=A0A150XLE5_ROSEK|nr:molecular chaperone HtpG [Roseivirga ehrenbergii]KYG79569.1 molecular chaperone HtpG [Roseivirga ehrenbergii]TCL01042.1 molecular chaperone HtpG [Roseivirga ehrenbergii]
MQEKGTISIHTENIFPIIKKFLYSDHEIFLRELVSNAVDASQKMKRLAILGEYKGDLGEVRVEVSVNKKKKTITISDRGIGMTAEEIKKYINQIAFSGATEFVEKFKDAGDAKEIIGKFGLGFYSAFMVADNVEIDTLSYQEGAEPARWICDGSTEFEITEGTRKERGTTITLHVNKDSVEFLEESRIQNVLTKYAKFLPIEVKFGEKDKQVEDGEDKEGKKKYKTVKEDNIINNTTPLWTKSPNDLTDEDYLNFYKELYPFSEEPLFWIHLNVDYPFELTGILYFPKLKKDFEVQKNKIQLYSRQVFITDETKDVVPEFLMLLHGVIDSPDIPLNVSRSYLQSDGNVKKINTYISKKVADKLSELFKKERESYESKWEDIGLFVKYGMISDEKFYDKAKDFVLVKNTAGKYFTMKEYEAHIEANQVDKDNNKVWLYATNVAKQDSFISDAVDKGYDVIVLDTPIDSHFINHMETKLENTQIKRVDADNIDKLIDKDEKRELVINDEQKEAVKGIFDKAINNKAYTVAVEPLAPSDAPVSVTMPEFMRRMKDMQATGGGGFNMFGSMPDNYNVTVNGNHKLVDKIIAASADGDKEGLAKQAFDLALLSQGLLEGKALTDFIKRSTAILGE